jgi:MFS family permease
LHKSFFYGWWITITALVVNAILSAPAFGATGLWVDSLEADFGWSRTQLAIAFSLGQLEGSAAAPLVGYLIDKIGGRKVSMFGTAVSILGFVLLALTTPVTDSREHWFDPAIFYLAYCTIMFGGTLAGWIPMTVIINNWFDRQRSLAMAIGSVGFSVGTFAIVPLLAYMVNPEILGWKWTAVSIAAFLPLIIIATFIFIRDRPQDMGLLPDGLAQEIPNRPLGADRKAANIDSVDEKPDFTIGEALKEKVFWIIALGHGASAMLTSTMMVHLILAFKDQGLSLQTSATMWGVAMGVGGISQLLGGVIGDRYSKRYCLIIFGCLQSVGVATATSVTSIYSAILFVIIYGIGFGARAPITTAMRGEYFGRTSFGKIMGISAMPMMLMTMVAPVVAGRMFDSQGNYEQAFLYIAAVGFVGSLIFVFARAPIHPSLKQR